MSKKSKKRKRKKSSSSSSDEDEETSKEKDSARSYKHESRRQEPQTRCAAQQENSVSSASRNDSRSSRHIKKPVYRLSTTQATETKPVNKPEECSKNKSVSSSHHTGHYSSKTKHHTSGKDNTSSRSKSVERGYSKSSRTPTSDAVSHKKESISKGCSDEKSFQQDPSKSKKLTSLASGKQKEPERRQNEQKRCRVEETPKTGNDRNTNRIKEPSKTPTVSQDSLQQKKEELIRKFNQMRRERHLKEKRNLCTERITPSASTTNQSSTSAKQTTSESSSKVKNLSFIPRSVTSMSHKPVISSSTASLTKPLPLNFKIPKNVQPRSVDKTGGDSCTVPENRNLSFSKFTDSDSSISNSKQETVVQQHQASVDVTPSFSSERQKKSSSLQDELPTTCPPATCSTTTEPWCNQMQVVEEIHLARAKKTLEVNVMQSYGELTCMDIDPTEEGATDTYSERPPQQDLILVLDTNILLSHLDYVKKTSSHGLGALGFPVVLIPWVVLQELDSLKRGKDLSGSVAHLATPAISYIYNSLKSRQPHLWGQSMQQAAEISNGLSAENNDDRVLQCCLQYQSLYPGCALILCTNDKNLCSKALLSGVKALSKNDLDAEVGRAGRGLRPLQNVETPLLPPINPQISTPMPSQSCTSAAPHSQERTGLVMKHNQQLSEREVKTKWDLSRCVSELENSLQEVLSDVLESEMKAAFGDLWLEIVYVKPPWTLQDVLQCLKKHWIAVFGHIVERKNQQTVLNLIEFFNSDKTVDCDAIVAAVQEAKMLVKAFVKSSSRAASAISVMDAILRKLQTQGDSPSSDIVMNDDDEDKQTTSAQVSHQEVWALFQNIWDAVCHVSTEVFKALGFDPNTTQSAQPAGGPPPPQDALAYLHKVSAMVSQLLQAFSSVLSSAPSLEEVETLLSIIHSYKIVNVDSRLKPRDLLDCFSQQDYRSNALCLLEQLICWLKQVICGSKYIICPHSSVTLEKLRFGGIQLMELKEALDRCVGVTSQSMTFTT